jgi:hypothetical protein
MAVQTSLKARMRHQEQFCSVLLAASFPGSPLSHVHIIPGLWKCVFLAYFTIQIKLKGFTCAPNLAIIFSQNAGV